MPDWEKQCTSRQDQINRQNILLKQYGGNVIRSTYGKNKIKRINEKERKVLDELIEKLEKDLELEIKTFKGICKLEQKYSDDLYILKEPTRRGYIYRSYNIEQVKEYLKNNLNFDLYIDN